MLTHVTAIDPIATTDTFKHGDLEVEGSRETSTFLRIFYFLERCIIVFRTPAQRKLR